MEVKIPGPGFKRHFVAAAAACCLFASMPLMAQVPDLIPQEPAEAKPQELDPIVIYGGLATPKMWQVSKDGHVLWVLGDTTAPAGTTWRFEQVEARVAESQLVIYPGSAHPDFSFFKMITLLPAAYKAYKAETKLPDNKTLKDVLPPEVYERWRVLKAEYAPREKDLERLNPSIAIEKLEAIIGEKLGEQNRPVQPPRPPPGPALRPLVDKAAKQHRVKVRTMPDVEWKIEMKEMRRMVKYVSAGHRVVDAVCVAQKLDYLERRIEYLKHNAVAPAQAEAPARVPPCDESAVMDLDAADTAELQKMIEKMQLQEQRGGQQLDAEWIAAAQAALAENMSTIAVLRMGWNGDVSRLNGYIAKLRELGYEVQEPGGVGE